MIPSVWMMWLMVLIFAVLSIILLSGRGSFLIAGFNTSSKEIKAQYHEKKLCRVAGGGLSAVAGIMGLFVLYQFSLPAALSWLIPWGLFGVIAATIILANTICKVK